MIEITPFGTLRAGGWEPGGVGSEDTDMISSVIGTAGVSPAPNEVGTRVSQVRTVHVPIRRTINRATKEREGTIGSLVPGTAGAAPLRSLS